MVGFSPVVFFCLQGGEPIYQWALFLIWLIEVLNPYHDLLCLKRASRCGLNPQLGHVQEVTYPCFSLILAHLPLSPN